MANARVPPHDEIVEQSLLGAILLDKEALIDVAEFLRVEHFYSSAHAAIFEAMLALFEKRDPIDVVTLSAQLKKLGKLDVAGGGTYLSEIVNIVPTAAHAEQYGRIIHDHFVKRRLINLSARLTDAAFKDEGEAQSVLEIAEQEVFAIAQQNIHRDFVAIKEALATSFDRLDELHKLGEGMRGVPTGFYDVDQKLAGMQDSNLLILAARPGTGKTAFTLNIAQNAAYTHKQPVAYFSLEMSKEELVDRMLVAQADIDAWRLKTGKLSDEDFTRLSDAMGQLAEAPIFIDDTPGITVMEMRTKARRIQMEHGIKLIIVDYLQLVNPGKKFESRNQEVSYVSQNLKNIARELKIPVLACSQLSRAVEARGTKEPQLSDLRESGAIEQDADVVMFLYRPELEEGEKWSSTVLTKLLIAKHRNGALGEIDLMFRGDRIKFFGMDKKHAG